jgi:hypothetical protein
MVVVDRFSDLPQAELEHPITVIVLILRLTFIVVATQLGLALPLKALLSLFLLLLTPRAALALCSTPLFSCEELCCPCCGRCFLLLSSSLRLSQSQEFVLRQCSSLTPLLQELVELDYSCLIAAHFQ